MDKLFEHFGIGDWAGPARGPIRAVLIVLLSWLALKIVRNVLGRSFAAMAKHGTDGERAKRLSTLSQVVGYVVTLGASLITAMLALAELGVSIAPLIASAGIAGVAIGFGAQSLVKDYFTGLVLLLENQIREGDFVELEGKTGTVEEVTLRYVRLRDKEGSVHFVPNGEIKAVTTKSRDFAYAFVQIAIDNEANLDEVFAAFREAGAEVRKNETLKPLVLADLELQGVEELTESAVVIRARMKTAASKQWEVRRELLRVLKNTLDRHGVEFPVARTTLDGALRALPAAE